MFLNLIALKRTKMLRISNMSLIGRLEELRGHNVEPAMSLQLHSALAVLQHSIPSDRQY